MEIPQEAKWLCYGLDFGFSNDPTAMVSVHQLGDSLYIHEMIFRTGMTNQDIGNELAILGLDRRDPVWCDSAEPKSIEEIHRMGWNTKSTKKGEINLGIDMLRRYNLYVTESSQNVVKE